MESTFDDGFPGVLEATVADNQDLQRGEVCVIASDITTYSLSQTDAHCGSIDTGKGVVPAREGCSSPSWSSRQSSKA